MWNKISTESQAKKYIKERVRAELSYQNCLTMLLPKYAKAILKSELQEDIDLLIKSLLDKIEEYIRLLATANAQDDEDEENAIWLFLATERNGKTLHQVLSRHISDWQGKLPDAGGDYGYYPLTRYGRYMIACGWTKYLYDMATKQGALSYRVFRGSSYSCPICDYECSYTHFSLDTLPPYHAHCCCYILPVYPTGFL